MINKFLKEKAADFEIILRLRHIKTQLFVSESGLVIYARNSSYMNIKGNDMRSKVHLREEMFSKFKNISEYLKNFSPKDFEIIANG